MHNYHNLCEKEPKIRVLAILSSLVRSNGLILHILIDKNDSEVITVVKMLGRVIDYAL